MRGHRPAWVSLLAAIILPALSPSTALAWMRFPYVDAQVVERSEAILVGHLVKESITCCPWPAGPGVNGAWEYHATLVVTEVLKGNMKEKVLPVVIQYGLTPVVGGIEDRKGEPIDWRPNTGLAVTQHIKPENYPKDVVEIMDTSGNFAWPSTPLVPDAAKDNVWLLRKQKVMVGDLAGKEAFYIEDPEDLQPLALKNYYAAHLAKDPEAAVKQEIAGKPDLARRGQESLTFLEVLRIERNPDAKARAEALVPYFLKPFMFSTTDEVKKALLASGDAGGQVLIGVFKESKSHDVRYEIMRIWEKMGYAGCADTLIDLLKDNETFFAAELEKPQPRPAEPAPNESFNRWYDVMEAVDILGKLYEPKAKDILERTRLLWSKFPPEGEDPRRVIQYCNDALDLINRTPPGKK